MSMIVCQIFFCFLFLLKALIVKNSLILAGIYLSFEKLSWNKLKESLDTDFGLWCKDQQSSYSSKTKFGTFLQLSYSNFILKLCEKLYSYQNC